MSGIFLDTNIILDLLAARDPFYESAAKLFSLADRNKVQLSVSALSFATTHYVLSSSLKDREAKEIIRRFKVLVEIIPLTEKIIDLALNDTGFSDFEDALQYYSALESQQHLIISRDQKGYRSSRLPVMTAEEYLVAFGGVDVD